MKCYSSCDLIADFSDYIIEETEQRGSFLDYSDDEGRAFYITLPDTFIIYRGGNVGKKLSWTTDRAVADGFARGHRGIVNSQPIVWEAVAKKSDIIAVIRTAENRKFLSMLDNCGM